MQIIEKQFIVCPTKKRIHKIINSLYEYDKNYLSLPYVIMPIFDK
jgi:hypothetical protein